MRRLIVRTGGALAPAVLVALVVSGCVTNDALPPPPPSETLAAAAPGGDEDTERLAIESREICVGSTVASAGTLGETLYYRASVLPNGNVVVGYFAFFSEERPWGNNWLTWTVIPALAVDMVYTRAMFTAPGLQRALHGKGDVEGFRIEYSVRPDGTLKVEHADADDGGHAKVHFDADEVFALDPDRPTFYSNVWSHQLGGRGARGPADLSYLRCFGPGRIAPLSDAIASDFAIAHRASPAHVEALGGRPLGAQVEASAKVVPARSRF